MFLSSESHDLRRFCRKCHPPEERYDLAPSPLTPRRDGGYSFFGKLAEFGPGCKLHRMLRASVLHFARAFRGDVDPEKIRVQCSSLTRLSEVFPSEILFEFTDILELSSIAIQVNNWACEC